MKKRSKMNPRNPGKGTKKTGGTVQKGSKPDSSELVPIPEPDVATDTRVDRVFPGQPIPPITRVRTFSASEWEEFTQEWAHSLKSRYHTVMRCSGAGDMGRDVVAHTGEISKGQPWDNYQCKHYDHALRPSDIWIEVGKLVHYTFHDEVTVPRQYSFICPHDVGTTLARLLERPKKLRDGLMENWTKYCQRGIGSEDVPLTGKFRQYVSSFPFEIVTFLPVLTMIEDHLQTPWHVHRFGGGLPDRPNPECPPDDVAAHEIPYSSELLRAYSDNKKLVVTESSLPTWPKLRQHFLLSRASFYSAESLQEFSRDHLPEREYERLKDEVHNGVQETYLDDQEDGYRKVLAVAKSAIELQITDHALLPVLQRPDLRGICHQLVNDGRLIWVEEKADDD